MTRQPTYTYKYEATDPITATTQEISYKFSYETIEQTVNKYVGYINAQPVNTPAQASNTNQAKDLYMYVEDQIIKQNLTSTDISKIDPLLTAAIARYASYDTGTSTWTITNPDTTNPGSKDGIVVFRDFINGIVGLYNSNKAHYQAGVTEIINAYNAANPTKTIQ